MHALDSLAKVSADACQDARSQVVSSRKLLKALCSFLEPFVLSSLQGRVLCLRGLVFDVS